MKKDLPLSCFASGTLSALALILRIKVFLPVPFSLHGALRTPCYSLTGGLCSFNLYPPGADITLNLKFPVYFSIAAETHYPKHSGWE